MIKNRLDEKMISKKIRNECSFEQKFFEKEQRVTEMIDKKGNKWRKIYFGGGEHLKRWLEQFKELGEIKLEEVKAQGLKCFEEAGEKLYRVWLKEGSIKLDNDLYE